MARIETVIAVMAMCLFPAAHSVAADSKLPAAQPLVDSPLNLLERLPVARIGVDDASLESLPIDSADYFAGGWYQPAEAGDGQQYRWLGPGAGVIDIALVQAEELMVSFGVTAPRDDRVPPIHARFLWNGAYAGGIELGGAPQTVKMKVPAELTRPGMNRLEVLPSFWVNASRLAGGSSSTNVSINVFRVTIAPTADASNRVRGLRPVVRAGVGVEQFANSTVSYYTRIEKGSRLTAAGRWLDDSHGVERSEALVLVRDGRGNTKTILHADSGAYVDPVASVADLSEFAGEFVEITTIVRQASESGSRPRPMLWTELSVTEESLPSVATTRVLDERPNIVLLMFDTLRADFTEPYGATDVSTPNFRALAEESATFLNAFAPTSWTRSSVATMMSSLHETRHGTVTIADKLAEEVPYLPERLRDNGYRTIGISMNGHITRQWGFDRGFDAFHELGRQREQIVNEDPTPDGYMNGLWDRYVAPERENAAGPFFLYFHEIDPHGPYTPRAPFDAMYPSPYSGHPELEADNINLVRQGLTELRPQDIAHLRTRYRGEVSFIDAVLGALMNRLRAEGLADNTILIVTSDHGEEFGEHRGIGHRATVVVAGADPSDARTGDRRPDRCRAHPARDARVADTAGDGGARSLAGDAWSVADAGISRIGSVGRQPRPRTAVGGLGGLETV